MTVSVNYVSQVTAQVSVSGDFVSTDDDTVTINGMNTTLALDGDSTPAVTKVSAFAQALTAGAATINLAALPGITADETIDGTGLKVQVVKLQAPSDNAGAITIVPGASNGYNLFGASSVLVIPAGAEVTAYLPEGTPDIASGARTLDLSGTGTDVLNVEISMG